MNRKRKIKVACFSFSLAFLFWFVPFVPAFVLGTINQTRYIYSTSTSFQKLVGPGHPGWTEMSSVSKHVLAAFICAEDSRFYDHSGLDFEAIRKSWEHNKKAKKKIRGGSTITQQVVKVGLLSYERSYIRKIREAIGAVLLEKMLSKNEILEWYINMVEFGDGIYGISEASKAYFKTKPEKLTISQAISLAIVLPAPNKWSKGLKEKRLSPFNQQRFRFILKQMLLNGYITKAQWEQSMANGNFDRPIAGYSESIGKVNKEEPSEVDPISELDEGEIDVQSAEDTKNIPEKTTSLHQQSGNLSTESEPNGSPAPPLDAIQSKDAPQKTESESPSQKARSPLQGRSQDKEPVLENHENREKSSPLEEKSPVETDHD